MKPCKECGRVNPPEAAYCMTCATPLTGEKPREEGGWRDYRREEPFYNTATSSTRTDNSTASSTSKDTSSRTEDGRFEKVAPVVEDFVFDMVRAGARLYFGMRDPEAAHDPYRRGGQSPSSRDRFERLKDVIAEARVAYRNRGQQPNGDRSRR